MCIRIGILFTSTGRMNCEISLAGRKFYLKILPLSSKGKQGEQSKSKSYLSNRKQFVTTYICKSDKEYITCGIPQGSVLGPTLFLIYINDLPDCHAMQTLLFADDTALLLSGPNILDLQNTINDELKNVQKWFTQNKLTLNLNQTNYLLFHPAKEKQSHHFC